MPIKSNIQLYDICIRAEFILILEDIFCDFSHDSIFSFSDIK